MVALHEIVLRDLVAAGYVSPDLKTNADLNNDVLASKVAMRANSWPNYYGFGGQALVKAKINIRAVPPLAADAKSQSGHLLSFGAFGFSPAGPEAQHGLKLHQRRPGVLPR